MKNIIKNGQNKLRMFRNQFEKKKG